MRLMGQVFVMGRTIEEAIKRMDAKRTTGFTASFDMLGEAARTRADAERYFEAYQGAIAAVGANPARGHSVSVKLSALHPRYETAKAATCVPELVGDAPRTCVQGGLARRSVDHRRRRGSAAGDEP
jgi:RHH-type proline utilization regulon transcriptional repressor/proline dehydrogenase/delta 1-pyrroline-5-carboxylate dehydrogenase